MITKTAVFMWRAEFTGVRVCVFACKRGVEGNQREQDAKLASYLNGPPTFDLSCRLPESGVRLI